MAYGEKVETKVDLPGEIESLWKKDIAPPGEVYGKMHELDSFSVNTKRPGSKKTDASDGK